MGHLLAKWIYPHFHNDHRPYALRHQALFTFVVLIALSQVVVNTFSGSYQILGYATNITKAQIINLTNAERSQEGLNNLQGSFFLDQAAANKADHMFKHDYWAHFAPDGTSPWYFFDQAGYSYTWAGENLAKDFQTSPGVVAGWMASTAGHRENILSTNFTEIGVAVKNGVLLGEETTLVVQLFGNPVNYTASAQGGNSAGSDTSFTGPSGTAATVEDALQVADTTAASQEVITQGSQESVASEGVVGNTVETINIAGLVDDMSTSQKTSFGLLFVLGSLFAVDSAVLVRRKHIRVNSHSGMHLSIVAILMITLAAQSIGSIV